MKLLIKITLGAVGLVALSGCTCHRNISSTGDPRAMMSLENIGTNVAGMRSVHFAFDRYDLQEPSKEILRENAAWLRENSNTTVVVEGHTDERGTLAYNMVLGENRADAAKRYLMALGVPEGRMRTVSYGEEMPVDPNANEQAWAKNRRAEFNTSGR